MVWSWTATRTKGGTFVAWCDPLGLTVLADSEDEMHAVIARSQQCLLVKFLEDRGCDETVAVKMTNEGVMFELPFRVGFVSHEHVGA